jgi:hypothetical protein
MPRDTDTTKRLQRRFHTFMQDMRLSPEQAAALCGMTVDYVRGLPGILLDTLPPAAQDRMRMVAHLHELLDMAFDTPRQGRTWMGEKNGVFGGKTPLEYLLSAPFTEEALISLIDYLDNYLYRYW